MYIDESWHMRVIPSALCCIALSFCFSCSVCDDYHLCAVHALETGFHDPNRDHDSSHLLVKIKTPGVCDRAARSREVNYSGFIYVWSIVGKVVFI